MRITMDGRPREFIERRWLTIMAIVTMLAMGAGGRAVAQDKVPELLPGVEAEFFFFNGQRLLEPRIGFLCVPLVPDEMGTEALSVFLSVDGGVAFYMGAPITLSAVKSAKQPAVFDFLDGSGHRVDRIVANLDDIGSLRGVSLIGTGVIGKSILRIEVGGRFPVDMTAEVHSFFLEPAVTGHDTLPAAPGLALATHAYPNHPQRANPDDRFSWETGRSLVLVQADREAAAAGLFESYVFEHEMALTGIHFGNFFVSDIFMRTRDFVWLEFAAEMESNILVLARQSSHHGDPANRRAHVDLDVDQTNLGFSSIFLPGFKVEARVRELDFEATPGNNPVVEVRVGEAFDVIRLGLQNLTTVDPRFPDKDIWRDVEVPVAPLTDRSLQPSRFRFRVTQHHSARHGSTRTWMDSRFFVRVRPLCPF